MTSVLTGMRTSITIMLLVPTMCFQTNLFQGNGLQQRQSKWQLLGKPTDRNDPPSTNSIPTNSLRSDKDWTMKALKSLSILGSVALPLLSSTKAKAVGNLFELKEQSMVIQDISFNVANTFKDSDALITLFQNNLRQLRDTVTTSANVTVLGFGPDAYDRYVTNHNPN